MAATKMLALFALLALSWSAVTATIFPQAIPTAAALVAAINHPCTQYCMLQQPFTTASPCNFQQQQQCALHCTALSQMIQQIVSQVASPYQCSPVAAAMQQVPFLSNPMLAAAMAIQSPNLFNPAVAAALQSSYSYQFNPVTAAAVMQQVPFLSNPLQAATTAIQSPNLYNPAVVAALQMQSPYTINPVAAAMQASYLFNPAMAVAMQQPFALNPFTGASQCC